MPSNEAGHKRAATTVARAARKLPAGAVLQELEAVLEPAEVLGLDDVQVLGLPCGHVVLRILTLGDRTKSPTVSRPP